MLNLNMQFCMAVTQGLAACKCQCRVQSKESMLSWSHVVSKVKFLLNRENDEDKSWWPGFMRGRRINKKSRPPSTSAALQPVKRARTRGAEDGDNEDTPSDDEND
eukprot:2414176-Amphidinium_carterae.1